MGALFRCVNLKAALHGGWFGGCGFQCEGGGWDAFGGCGDRDVAGWGGGAEDCDGIAIVEFSIFFWSGCLEGVVVQEIAVVDCDDSGWAAGGEMDAGFAVGDDSAVAVDKGCGDVGDVIPVRREEVPERGARGAGICRKQLLLGQASCIEVPTENNICGFAGSAEGVFGDDFAIGAGNGFNCAGFEGDFVGDGGGVGVKLLSA